LCLLDFARVSLRSIVEAVQMQEAMNDVQSKFTCERTPERASVPLRGIDTYKNFAVLKREHIRWSFLAQELPM
jgi:hypothetical protein